MNISQTLTKAIGDAFSDEFNVSLATAEIHLQPTRREFEGSHTLICFSYARHSKKNPEETAKIIGEFLQANCPIVKGYNVVKGFLNLVLTDTAWLSVFKDIAREKDYGFKKADGREVIVEYSSPNTNKPLHLGHLRNNFLGWSVAEILRANGYTVHKVQIINDRGIHICKSMVAWQLFGDGETPQSSGKKGDKLVGDYYVAFDKAYKKQVEKLIDEGMEKEEAEKEAPILQQAQQLLLKWEQKDPDVYDLWKTMNGWVYEGFDTTYRQMGVDFDKLYYESGTFLLGKEQVLQGLKDGIFFRKDDGSVWADLTNEGLDEKLLLRADGTSVYMTQDIGTAILRFQDFPRIEKQIYTVGNEQEYHFKVLFLILEKLGYTRAKACYHLSYGMVDLPSGKMKSREGTVVDADELMGEMIDTAEAHTTELGKVDDFSEDQAAQLYETLGIGALKYFLLKVSPQKRMLFNPKKSIELQGNTAPFIQYTHARISAILRKARQLGFDTGGDPDKVKKLHPAETDIIRLLADFPLKVEEAGLNYSPDIVAQYVYDLAKEYNRFYQEISIFNEQDDAVLRFRVALSAVVADTIKRGMGLLGIKVPERM